MRGRVGRIRSVIVILCCIACAGFFLLLSFSPVFRGGYGYELYTGSSSGLVVRTETPFSDKLKFHAKGESVRYNGDRSKELIEVFRGRLQFTEETCGVKNYYLYSPFLKVGVFVNGKYVNLHIAVNAEQTAVGTPLIFGGF